MKTKIKSTAALAAMGLVAMSCQTESNKKAENPDMKPPIAKKLAEELSAHGDTRIDNYFWMRLSDEQKESKTPDEQTQEVVAYLNAENAYTEAVMKHTEDLQKKLYDEIVGKIKQDDQSVPVSYNGYSYYSRFEEGEDYGLNCRIALTENAEEEIMLNQPEMAKGHAYFSLGDYEVSEDNELCAYSIDTISRREYTIHVKNLKTGEVLADKIDKTSGRITWANDNKTFFYTKQDPVTLRSFQVYKHVLGTDPSTDELVFEETDETFNTYVFKSKSRKYLMIQSSQTLSTEIRFLDADTPNGEWKMLQPRERNLEYAADHYDLDFYIVTNLDAKNFRLMRTPVEKPSKENWEEVIEHRDNVLLEGIDIFKNQLVVTERENGLLRLRVMPWSGLDEHYIAFEDPTYTVYTTSNPEFDTEILRYNYTSLTTPSSVYDYNMVSKDRELLKQQEVLDENFAPDNYESERIFANAKDGTKIPISIVYKKGFKKDGSAPVLLYGYGSYGATMDPWFSIARLSLMDRGVAFAVAHIRGGQEMGRDWYENGKMLNKMNTFTDFIDCGQFLIDNKYTSAPHLYAQGGSAGGLLMGAIINLKPEIWNGVLAAVPFVDVVSTMMDETIPLTTGEFDEWGNPKDSIYYEYIKSYSPYDNIEAKAYPNLLITTGYWDSQVQYWEPAKWIAKLRDMKTDDNILIMDCNMDVGHGGASGRFERIKEIALEYAFILDLEGIYE